MKIGFTGTRYGMTPKQKETVENLLKGLGRIEVHHGDCVGADAELHAIARELELKIAIHPPVASDWRAFCEGDEVYGCASYRMRNTRIVDATEILIATPRGSKEVHRSGTWMTVRIARGEGRHIIIVWPDGSAQEEGNANDPL